ncbi:MAG: hypothetical protein L0177_01545 [Chloroflexi bacterium]|nr:hypothetical protein [Chloroflexota bacterium]
MGIPNLHVLAVTTLSVANVWLAVQTIRWLMYSSAISRAIPSANQFSAFDPILEAPGIIVGLIAAYVLLYRLVLNIWRLRDSMYGSEFATRALSINSLLLILLTAGGISQWILLFHRFPVDLIVVVAFGGVAAITSYYLERRLVVSGHVRLSKLLPFAQLHQLAALWRSR